MCIYIYIYTHMYHITSYIIYYSTSYYIYIYMYIITSYILFTASSLPMGEAKWMYTKSSVQEVESLLEETTMLSEYVLQSRLSA